MKIKGVVFDFNGTLFWDTAIHNLAWNTFFEKLHIKVSDKEKHEKLHGKDNKRILKEFLGTNISEKEILNYSIEKEQVYRNFCAKSGLKLAECASDFLDFLKARNIPFTIATASEWENVVFYFEYLKLEKYFDISKVVYSDGKIKSKPDPDMYKKAIKILNLKSYETLIFEDSFSGIKAAENALVGKIIIVNSNNEDYSEFPHQKIKNFKEIDLRFFD